MRQLIARIVFVAAVALVVGAIPPAAAASQGPLVTLQPSQGQVGNRIQVTGSGWTPQAPVQGWLDQTIVDQQVIPDSNGSFSTSFIVPNVSAGPHPVSFVSQSERYPAVFTVTTTTTPPGSKPPGGQPPAGQSPPYLMPPSSYVNQPGCQHQVPSLIGLVIDDFNPLKVGPGDLVQMPTPASWAIKIAELFTGGELNPQCLYGTPRNPIIVQPIFFGESTSRVHALEGAAEKRYGIASDHVVEVRVPRSAPLRVAMPIGLTARPAGPRAIRLSWKDRSVNEAAFVISNGVTVRQVPRNRTSYLWAVTPGKYMCFKVKAVNGNAETTWYPNFSPWYVCTTTPKR